MKCLTWNLAWAAAGGARMRLIAERIQELDPDVVCYTEVNRVVIPPGNVVESVADYGYSSPADRRKVILWSRIPWTEVDTVGDPALPSGRFVSGVTGGVRFVGVCIPWKDAHVTTGRKDRKPWEDHLCFCAGLKGVLDCYSARPEPICVLGDFNQRIPRDRELAQISRALLEAFPPGFAIVTAGLKDAEGKGLIDHIAVSATLEADMLEIVARFGADGMRLSDHTGIAARLARH